MISADVLEALHRATGLPIVADYYTRLYSLRDVSVQNLPLFAALNHLADAMRLRWNKEGEWLQFRSTGFFHDRLKEVPNRLLTRWATSRQRHGALTLDDLMEIAQLSDAQLDAASMAEGARACFGLAEWDLPRVKHVRAQLRFLTEFTPEQRQQAQTPAGLSFSQMNLAQQQGYFARGLRRTAGLRLDNLAQATLHVDYTLPGWFRWSPPGRAFQPSPIRERTRDAALQSALRLDPQTTETRILPTRLDVTFLYTPNHGGARLVRTTDDGWISLPEIEW